MKLYLKFIKINYGTKTVRMEKVLTHDIKHQNGSIR